MPQIPDHSCRILIVGGSESGKTNASLNLVSHQQILIIFYLCAKDLCEEKYQLLINTYEGPDIKHFTDSEALIEYPNDMDDIYKNIEEYNSYKKRKILIVFDEMIADMLSNKKLNPIVIKYFIRGRNENISSLFIAQSYFAVPKKFRRNFTLTSDNPFSFRKNLLEKI